MDVEDNEEEEDEYYSEDDGFIVNEDEEDGDNYSEDKDQSEKSFEIGENSQVNDDLIRVRKAIQKDLAKI